MVIKAEEESVRERLHRATDEFWNAPCDIFGREYKVCFVSLYAVSVAWLVWAR